ncbi:YjbF family lipoprotein [Vibrio sp. SM6]|uniref:YjbF family lipoprotein n=1 Tax=Vibrio agarilyticus TaxID=2726741 RepID=A0A7X8TS08_9VIBR|nr:YjbF family lipoprotein [Vibrio agarilyticus]NLS13547.1 YjbF family lipoprotein [Vibrio agarilyticus]
MLNVHLFTKFILANLWARTLFARYMFAKSKGLFLLTSLSLLGCSQPSSHLNATLKEAFIGAADVVMSEEQLQQFPYASAYVTVNDGPRAFMVLSHIDETFNGQAPQLKWVSSDYAMIATQNGRIIKTVHLPSHNLIRRIDDSRNNTATYDWQPNNAYDNHANVSLLAISHQSLVLPLWQGEVTYWQERVEFPKLNQHIINHYWVDSDDVVRKTRQQLGPEQDVIEMEFVKPYIAPNNGKTDQNNPFLADSTKPE